MAASAATRQYVVENQVLSRFGAVVELIAEATSSSAPLVPLSTHDEMLCSARPAADPATPETTLEIGPVMGLPVGMPNGPKLPSKLIWQSPQGGRRSSRARARRR